MPEFDPSPADATADMEYSLLNAPIFIEINDGKVEIQTNVHSYARVYEDLELVATDKNTGIEKTQSFDLTVTCIKRI